ncbi:hypothetical protein HF086_017421 [Spodoptera exigua]|uniref:Uncharacterized protein n=1 Tax=Spodoptera exigua TaxID=7107 RepID=A0A922SDE6_SPOEX|nr:hypothetical protein HF086_017421 [Spodoptera exigua]
MSKSSKSLYSPALVRYEVLPAPPGYKHCNANEWVCGNNTLVKVYGCNTGTICVWAGLQVHM